jgi:hypothetical protein
MTYEEYKKMRQQIMDEYQKELASLDMVWKRFQNINSPNTEMSEQNNEKSSYSANFSKHVRIAIQSLKQDFSADEVQQALIDHGLVEKDKVNRIAITNTLHRLHRRNEIEVVQKGHGRIGAIYKLLNVKGGQ